MLKFIYAFVSWQALFNFEYWVIYKMLESLIKIDKLIFTFFNIFWEEAYKISEMLRHCFACILNSLMDTILYWLDNIPYKSTYCRSLLPQISLHNIRHIWKLRSYCKNHQWHNSDRHNLLPRRPRLRVQKVKNATHT